ncbi:MAG: hypothetical protein RL211_1339 [Pseudomonadota bacterium]|jgi:soluble cytochrome b562
MAAKPKRIKGKLLYEAYTPAESDADGYSDGIDYAAVVGNKRFHSFQVWREKAGDKPKYVYGLTLKQITAIRAQADAELSAQNAELREQIEAMRKALSELEKQSAAKGTALKEEIAKLRHDQQWLVQELKPVLKKRTNDSLDNGGKSIRATSIPMGGAPVYRLRVKRR